MGLYGSFTDEVVVGDILRSSRNQAIAYTQHKLTYAGLEIEKRGLTMVRKGKQQVGIKEKLM